MSAELNEEREREEEGEEGCVAHVNEGKGREKKRGMAGSLKQCFTAGAWAEECYTKYAAVGSGHRLSLSRSFLRSSEVLVHPRPPLPLLRLLQGLDDTPVNHARLVLGVVLEAVDVSRRHVERVALLEQLALGRVVVPLPLARIRDAELDC